jgi:hypothetical protein
MEGEILLGRAATTTCLASLDIRAMSEMAVGFKGRTMLEGHRPCLKSQETPGKKCERRLELVEQEMIDLFKTRQPARPVLPRISCRPNLQQIELDAIQTVQDIRDFEWDVLTQYSAYGCAYAWICDCYDEEEEV